MISKYLSAYEKFQINAIGKSRNCIYWKDGDSVIPLLYQPVCHKPQPASWSKLYWSQWAGWHWLCWASAQVAGRSKTSALLALQGGWQWWLRKIAISFVMATSTQQELNQDLFFFAVPHEIAIDKSSLTLLPLDCMWSTDWKAKKSAFFISPTIYFILF